MASSPVTPDRPSIEAAIDALERAARIFEEDGPTVANNQLLAAAREALLSRFLEQQKELLTPEEAQAVLSLPVWKSLVPQTAANFTALEKIRRRSIQPGGTPQKCD